MGSCLIWTYFKGQLWFKAWELSPASKRAIVADAGSGAILTPECGSGISLFRIPNPYFRELSNIFLASKCLNFLKIFLISFCTFSRNKIILNFVKFISPSSFLLFFLNPWSGSGTEENQVPRHSKEPFYFIYAVHIFQDDISCIYRKTVIQI